MYLNRYGCCSHIWALSCRLCACPTKRRARVL